MPRRRRVLTLQETDTLTLLRAFSGALAMICEPGLSVAVGEVMGRPPELPPQADGRDWRFVCGVIRSELIRRGWGGLYGAGRGG